MKFITLDNDFLPELGKEKERERRAREKRGGRGAGRKMNSAGRGLHL